MTPELLEEARRRIEQHQKHEAEQQERWRLEKELRVVDGLMDKSVRDGNAEDLAVYLAEYRRLYYLRHPKKTFWMKLKEIFT